MPGEVMKAPFARGPAHQSRGVAALEQRLERLAKVFSVPTEVATKVDDPCN